MIEKTLPQGYFMIANSTRETDYLKLAYVTALSIKLTQPEGYNAVSVATTNPDIVSNYRFSWVFDNVIAYEGPKGMNARSRVYQHTPYKETVFLDSDLLFLNDVSHWWHYMQKHDLYIATRPMTFRGETMTNRYFRATIDNNKLPDFYSGWLYFKQSRETTKFFRVLEALTDYPEAWKEQLDSYNFESIPTDEACALTAKMLDIVEDMSNPNVPFPRFTHMKSHCQGLGATDYNWTDQLPFYYDADLNVKLGPYAQTDILHYTKKDLITDNFVTTLENQIWNKFKDVL
jgi:hypothetical protein